MRTGPGTEFETLGTVAQGTALSVLGRNEDKSWWQVCCVNGQSGWMSNTVARLNGSPDQIPVSPPLMPDDLKATWAVRWECHSEGCKQEQCLGESQANALRVRTTRWLETKRVATWQDECGPQEDWLTQVDRYTGKEQSVAGSEALFSIWAGANPGAESRVLDLSGRTLSLWCTGTRTREVPQDQGWTVLYEGEACYDRASGIVVTLQYLKRWLYTGTFGGQTFDRQYFGDYEVYQQVLTETNAPLSNR
jgi:hypothetical protein